MWVRTQDKKQLVDIIKYSIDRNFGGKNKRAIVGVYAQSSFFQSTTVILGFYKTEAEAINELDNIQLHLENSENKVYEMN